MPSEGPKRRSRLRAVRGGAADNSAQEFERLYRENYRRVYNYVYSRFLDRTFAEDITSEAFIKAARSFKSFDADRAQFSTWVITIARNCAISEMRKSKPELIVSETAYDLDTIGVTDSYEDLGERERQVAALLSKLDDTDRELVYFKFFEGKKNKEIGELLGMNASTVGTKVQRAVAKLRDEAAAMGISLE